MQRSFSRLAKHWWYLLAVPMLVVLLAGCSTTASTSPTAGSTSGPGGTSATATSNASNSTPVDTGSGGSGGSQSTTAPQHAFAWTQYDGGSTPTPEIWASINGGTPYQVTHLTPITDGCDTQIAWGLPVFSPDLSHLLSSLGSYNCGDGELSGPLHIISANGSSSVTISNPVGGSGDAESRSSDRQYGWIDNTHIFFLDAGGAYTYTLGSATASQLPGISNAEEAILRGSTLFWTDEAFNSSTNNWTTTLHRYDMSSHSALSGSISLGQVHHCQCSVGDLLFQGWDASPDGSHVAYQVSTPATGSNAGIATSHVYYANADGSGASTIAAYMSTNQTVRMLISPNGQLVSIAAALPSPSVITASVSSAGTASDPNFHSYTPDGFGYAVWKWNSAAFWVGNRMNGDFESSGTKALYYHVVGSSSMVVGVNGGFNPWYTIVS